MSSGLAWAPQIAALTPPELESSYPICRATGASSSLDYPLSTDAVVADLLMLLDRCRMTDVSVVGVSLGGLIATQLARAKPEAVSKVIIADSPLRVTPDLQFNKSIVQFIVGVSKPGGFKNDPDDPLNPNQAIERHRRTLRPISHRLNHP